MANAVKDELRVVSRQDAADARHAHKVDQHLDAALVRIGIDGLVDLLYLARREIKPYARTKSDDLLVREGIFANGLSVRVDLFEQADSLKKLERKRFVEQFLI